MRVGTGRRKEPAARTPHVDETAIVTEYLGLVRRIARQYAARAEQVDDLVQEGVVGLLKAIRGFDPERGVPFESYARALVVGEIRHHLRDRSSVLRVPAPVQELRGRIRVLVDEARAETGREPDIAALASRAGVSDEAVVEAVTAGVVPLERDLPTADSELSRSEARADLDEQLALLDDREREVVYLRFFVDLTQSEIADRLEISQMHVSRILRGALETMRRAADA